MRPVVSIGLPVYNGARYLRGALDSVLSQTLADFELIISDNASTDATPRICREYSARDSRIRYLRNPENLGAAENYNRVFRESSGRYFKWIAHDDRYAPSFLARCLDVLENDPEAVLCYSLAVFIDEMGSEIGLEEDDVPYDLPAPHQRFRAWVFDKPSGWCHPITGLIRSSALARTSLIGRFNSADRVLVTELALHGKIRRLSERLLYRRDHPGRSMEQGHEEILLWYDPTSRRRRYRPVWARLAYEQWRAIARVSMLGRERILCTLLLLKWMIRIRAKLFHELRKAVRALFKSRASLAANHGVSSESPSHRP